MKKILPRKFPTRTIAFGVLLTVLIVGGLVHFNRTLFNEAQQTKRLVQNSIVLLERIRNLDELLTLLSKAAILTQDPTWKEQYDQASQDYDVAFDKIRQYAPSDAVEQLMITFIYNDLFKLETDAFQLLENKQYEQAKAILSSDEYAVNKCIYQAGLSQFIADFHTYLDEIEETQKRNLFQANLIGVAGLVLILASWVLISRALLRYHRTNQNRTADLVRTQEKLHKLVEIGVAFSAERDINTLLENILLGGKELTYADAGTLYLRAKENVLKFAIVRTDSLGIAMKGDDQSLKAMPPVQLAAPDGTPNHHNIASHAALTGETVVIADAYDSTEFDFSGVRKFDQVTGYHSQSFLTVPLKPRNGKVIGVLQLINATDPATGQVVPFDAEVVTFVEALAAQAAMTLDNQLLLQAQKDLFDAFIRLIAAAIDNKSPYTGGHCERVPELAIALAQAVCATTEGPFADFTMSPAEFHEMRIASWLHDCGKVTTPEYVVDKSTKLEAVHNRIHEVRTRFEVLYRDQEIAFLKGLLGEEELEAARQTLQEEFAFIARSNVGGEFMHEADKERIKQIAQRTWQRHFDDRLGLSWAELKRKGASCAEETLLADKEEHIIARERDTFVRDEAMGIKMTAPKHLYNMGEIYNLCIDRGTLTAEERYKINEHVVQTLVMLEELPFPEDMARVPEFAGTHHETMLGTGYPRQLTRAQMSVPARIMVIADIFEALTAADRPYKEPKRLSQAIRIMDSMRREGHIDSDLFEIFLAKGVYQQYADRFLKPFQIDPVEIQQFQKG